LFFFSLAGCCPPPEHEVTKGDFLYSQEPELLTSRTRELTLTSLVDLALEADPVSPCACECD
jgi:hypothetical protein